MKEYFTCQEVAERYKVKTLTVWAWIRERKLLATKIGKSYRVSNEDLEQFERERQTVNERSV